MHRRGFLKVSAGLFGTVLFAPQLQATTVKQGWLSGFKDRAGRFGVARIGDDFSATVVFYAPKRLHGISVHPKGHEIVAPVRRPSTELFIFDLDQRALRIIDAPQGQHFYGHGVFSKDGTRYFTSENEYDAEKGAIGIYDVSAGYKRIGQWDSGGIGPHEICLTQDGKSLIVANGGILTHPDSGRSKLNIETMRSNITRLDVATGQIKNQIRLESSLHNLSMRHMDVAEDGTVYIGAQDQMQNRNDVPLVWKWSDTNLKPLEEPDGGWAIFKGYIGSVCLNHMGQSVCVSSPRANALHIWGETKQLIKEKDVCGISRKHNTDFMVTTGQGNILDLTGQRVQQPFHFDNHCSIR